MRMNTDKALDPDFANRPETETDDRLVATADLAHAFGVSDRTIRRWCKSLDLPNERLRSGHRRYRLRDVRNWYRSAQEGDQRT